MHLNLHFRLSWQCRAKESIGFWGGLIPFRIARRQFGSGFGGGGFDGGNRRFRNGGGGGGFGSGGFGGNNNDNDNNNNDNNNNNNNDDDNNNDDNNNNGNNDNNNNNEPNIQETPTEALEITWRLTERLEPQLSNAPNDPRIYG
ncbi:hypothetical protein SODALDRAFT_357329 [Sodiomyces alkalinus F11]|uniref:Uncharacterized protein n=1 Tax=Sodiomyces alkalinus (strain CBS 110278 / VKM F-3762 / F11) TaxID=1314773 RepID=A0A3N2Q3E9_SODAK|nr:hypothetical protein SODALDRAFT_357329 [Sodiomyces alkalinus F11]ROT41293.1 hypothetical protein SODALDRAFT_357329 [Sodiomyces alkalinus F11]